ncbi:MAG: serine/threonine-protein kinase, partial [Planctomycetota bacterium]
MTVEKTIFGRYKVIQLLGTGGAGRVHLVEDLEDEGIRKALKVVQLRPGREETFDRIRGEFEILARYRHPHLARAHEIGREGSKAYFTMEYVRGTHLLESAGGLEREAILRLCLQVLRALAFLHGLGLVHGDVKPQNILVERREGKASARLIDFGLAVPVLRGRPTTLIRAGTPAYLPPEKVLGAPPDPRSDLYSFGVTLFHCLTGALPFEGDDPGSVIDRHRHCPPPSPRELDPTLPPGLADLCLRLLEKEPRRRFQSADAAIAALAPFVPDATAASDREEGRHRISAAFVGREDELEALEKDFAPALSGAAPPHRSVLVGVLGSGKSRLAREFGLDSRVRGIRVVEAACPVNPTLPLGPLASLARPLSGWFDSLKRRDRAPLLALMEGRIPGAVEGETLALPADLLSGLNRLFATVSKVMPLLLVLEDFHLAEPALVEAMEGLVGPGSEGRWALLITCRYRFVNPVSGDRFIPPLQRGEFPLLRLGPLGEEAVNQ